MLPDGDGALVIRTDFTHPQAWGELCALLRGYAPEGLLTDVRVVDDPHFEGMTTQQLLTLVPGGGEYAYLAVADGLTMASAAKRPQDRSVAIVDLDDEEEPGRIFRALVSELASIDATLSLVNLDFAEYADAVGKDGVHRVFRPAEYR
ncbi:DUF6924 domain-containing protein [Amycolatopsis sp. NPDC058986]|uniref:DUF6924 domain-containing protein n=1 Tax=Amycolatopsis sp. NPDC058986 TaxID=3346685 RepID=UPI003670DAAB